MQAPRHDPLPEALKAQGVPVVVVRAVAARLQASKRRKGRRDSDGEPCPVRPDRPLDLSGGAAAALEFGD
jgi:hypothetical protein